MAAAILKALPAPAALAIALLPAAQALTTHDKTLALIGSKTSAKKTHAKTKSRNQDVESSAKVKAKTKRKGVESVSQRPEKGAKSVSKQPQTRPIRVSKQKLDDEGKPSTRGVTPPHAQRRPRSGIGPIPPRNKKNQATEKSEKTAKPKGATKAAKKAPEALARPTPIADAAQKDNELETLKALRNTLALAIDRADTKVGIASLAAQLTSTLATIHEVEERSGKVYEETPLALIIERRRK
jgi:hypothetical protein